MFGEIGENRARDMTRLFVLAGKNNNRIRYKYSIKHSKIYRRIHLN
jgi:hypothetical protein